MMKKQIVIKLCGVEIYRGNFVPLSVHVDDHNGEETLLEFNPQAVNIQGEDLVALIETMSRNGALRIHQRSVQEF